jgi:FkbH-like protein
MTAAVADPTPEEQIAALLARCAQMETPDARTCLALARGYERLSDPAAAARWALAVTDVSDELSAWMAAAGVLRRTKPSLPRRARVAVLGSYTTDQYAALLPLAAARTGVDVEVYAAPYGQYRQEILDPQSGLYRFDPEVVILAVHAGATGLPAFSAAADQDVEQEVANWTGLWNLLRSRTSARVIQHAFAVPPEEAYGHLALKTAGSRSRLLHEVNRRLGEAAGDAVSLIDCESLASRVGKQTWFDARYWNLAKQAVALSCVPMLARHSGAVLAAQLGCSRKCLVLDLDNTLWGGVLGEDGIAGIQLGEGPVGEAYSAFQTYIRQLQSRGVVLAICSKNNEADVVEAFRTHPEMVLTLDDFAIVMAGWDDKPAQLRRIAKSLELGLDSLLFVDDNPAEREAVRQLVPEVDVLALPADPAGYIGALAAYPYFEPAAITDDDRARTSQYRARAEIATLQEGASSLEDFWGSLQMVMTVEELGEANLTRTAQLVGKTNQFNLTVRRRGSDELASIAAENRWISWCFRLTDRFANQGLIGVLLAEEQAGELRVDTWLMSCRVIGRSAEDEMMQLLIQEAQRRGCTRIIGEFRQGPKNALVAGLYERLGFQLAEGEPEAEQWTLDVDGAGVGRGFIEIVRQMEG